ncbi:hypothetical protein CVT24_012438 [Panaeolus cyanescens]|uniref:Uncharacterized protein n=1 Tax=Panaeolus cyanescens TaxID=181874 RepID=A0A409YJ79_9AGAR|nr:hypothetical protein CVT24_012438 [Panaeolus cyanescens]
MRARISQESGNCGIPQRLQNPTIAGKKSSFVLVSPGGKDDVNYYASIHQLEKLKEQAKTEVPRFSRVPETFGSFVKWAPGRVATLKVQQPLSKNDGFMYCLDSDPFYAFLIQDDIPDECKFIEVPIFPKDTNKPKGGKAATSVTTPQQKTKPPAAPKQRERFSINPNLIRDSRRRWIKAADFKSKLPGRLVDVTFAILGICPSEREDGKDKPCAFIARLVEMQLVDEGDGEDDEDSGDEGEKSETKVKGKGKSKGKSPHKESGSAKRELESDEDNQDARKPKVQQKKRRRIKDEDDDSDDEYFEKSKARVKRETFEEGSSTRPGTHRQKRRK